MRAAAEMLGQKVSDAHAKKLKPVRLRVHDYSGECRVTLESQYNFEVTRGYKARITLERGGRSLSAVIDRDELAMMLKLEGK